MGDVQVNIGNLKVFHISGTSSLIIGKSTLSDMNSESKTNNGIGSAYGDGSNINMSSRKSAIYDQDQLDSFHEEVPPARLWGQVKEE
ncbi:spore germination protein [Radiobacillus kanasensis]|uniref:spore germination protein n=1 Tax=Radiobacillus kanasensis TaxID=2844358 RepID=UPI001E447601|nr:spore germination protein [Radiobacillus kanasensis]UFU00551.1 spore germination protein [Radiobacillus kanasensis]